MASYSKKILSGSTSGKPIKVVATSTPGTTIHTAVSGATAFDEIYLYAFNTDTVARTITVEFGGTTDPDDHLVKALALPPSSGPWPIATGQVLNGGLVVKAFASAANVVTVTGFVNSIV